MSHRVIFGASNSDRGPRADAGASGRRNQFVVSLVSALARLLARNSAAADAIPSDDDARSGANEAEMSLVRPLGAATNSCRSERVRPLYCRPRSNYARFTAWTARLRRLSAVLD
jgi:hypothetical protein